MLNLRKTYNLQPYTAQWQCPPNDGEWQWRNHMGKVISLIPSRCQKLNCANNYPSLGLLELALKIQTSPVCVVD